MAAKKKAEVYKSKAAMKKHEKGEGKKMEKKEAKMGMTDKVKTSVKGKTASRKIVKSI
jgi:hypothetical protein